MIKFSYCLWQIIYSDNADISEDIGLPQSMRKWSFSWCWGTSPISFIAGHRILLRRALPQRWDNTRSSSPVTGFSGWATSFCGRDNLFVSCTKCIFVYWCFYCYFFRSVPAGQPLHALPEQSFNGIPVCLWIIKHAQGPVGEVSRLPSKDQPGYCAAADPLPLHRCVPQGARLNLSTLLKHMLVFLVQPFQGTEKWISAMHKYS